MNNLRFITPIKSSGPPPWTPSSKTLTVWFRMDHTTGSGASLTITDLGPNGYNATVANGTPSIVTNVINGQPVLRLNGANPDYLQFAGSNALMPPNSASTVVIVTKASAQLGSGNFACIVAFATQANAFEAFNNTNASGYAPMWWGAGDGNVGHSYVGISSFDYYSAFYGLVVIYNGGGAFNSTSNFTAYDNNVSQTVSAFTGVANSANEFNYIGAWPSQLSGLNYTGDIAEIILFAEALNSTDLSNLHTYLNNRYGSGVG